MNWGCTITNVEVEWPHHFSLTVKELALTVDNTNYKIPIMGRTGRGKSTLLNLMAALMRPKQGTISWSFPDNTTIEWSSGSPQLSAQKLIELRRHRFGFVFQDSTLIPHLRVDENLIYPLELKGMTTNTAYDIACEELNKVLIEGKEREDGVKKLLQKFPRQLSNGQRQRIALVQALIHDPNVLFADEPTGSLDSTTRQEVMNVVYKWLDKDPGKRLLIWVTHHDNDPEQAGVTCHLYIDDQGICRWQKSRQGNRQNEEVS